MPYTMLRRCTVCGTENRVPAEHLADAGRCGSCKNVLGPLGEPIAVDEKGFDAIVSGARVPILVDFWAEWCGPCRMAAPEVAAVAREMAGRAVVLKVDTEQEPRLATRFRVQGIPNFVVLYEGQVIFEQAGVTPRREMRRWLEAAASGSTRSASERV